MNMESDENEFEFEKPSRHGDVRKTSRHGDVRKTSRHGDPYHGRSVKYPAGVVYDINPSVVDPHNRILNINNNQILEKRTILEDHPIIQQYKKLYSKKLYLNSSELWDEVMYVLEENYEQKKINRVRGFWYSLETNLSYYLPVLQEKIHKLEIIPKKIERKEKKEQYIFKFMGQKMDTRLIYHRQNDNFKIYGEYKRADETFLLHHVALGGKLKVNGFGKDLVINTLNGYNTANMANMKLKKCSSNDFDIRHIEYDLGKNYPISHVSIMGKQHQSNLFPNYDERKLHRIKHGKSITFVDDITPLYVKSFELLIRRDKSKIWTNLGSFPGNTNRLVEIIHELTHGTFGRYIRIVPLSFQGEPSFQFAVYTPKVNHSLSENTNIKSSNPSSPELIEYEVSIPCITTKYISSGGNYRFGKFNKYKPLQMNNRQFLKEIHKKEMKQYYNNRQVIQCDECGVYEKNCNYNYMMDSYYCKDCE
jgi:hypothetical protein